MAIEQITDSQLSIAQQVQDLDTKGIEQQTEMKKQQAMADAQAVSDQISQKMAAQMYQLEDNVVAARKKLDVFVGKMDSPRLDPDDPSFDFKYSQVDMNAMIKPLMSTTAPLASVCGQVPVIGQLPSMFATMQMSVDKASDVDPEKIKAMVPKAPEVSPTLLSEIDKIIDDVEAACKKLPMMLTDLILQMINVIYSKLQIITSIIPLGDFFPLNLLGAAITAQKTISDFIMQAPSKIKALINGASKQVASAQIAMAVPQPTVGVPTAIASTTTTSSSSTTSSNSTTDKPDAAKTDAEKIASPIETSMPEVQTTPPAPQPSKTLEQVESEWEAEYKKLKLFMFEKNTSQNGIQQFAPRLRIDDEWTHVKKSIEYESLLNPIQANNLFKSNYRGIHNESGLGYEMYLIEDYRGYVLEKDKNGKTVAKLNDDATTRKYVGKFLYLCIDKYVEQHRLKYGDDVVKKHISRLKKNSDYQDPEYKKDIDAGVQKYSKLLDKYYFFNEDELPDFDGTAYLGAEKFKNFDY